ncbi:hypothetical protein V8F20_012697 [Naviculisporaceae sp. PSN 640]
MDSEEELGDGEIVYGEKGAATLDSLDRFLQEGTLVASLLGGEIDDEAWVLRLFALTWDDKLDGKYSGMNIAGGRIMVFRARMHFESQRPSLSELWELAPPGPPRPPVPAWASVVVMTTTVMLYGSGVVGGVGASDRSAPRICRNSGSRPSRPAVPSRPCGTVGGVHVRCGHRGIGVGTLDRNVPSTGTYPRPERTLDRLPEIVGTLGAAPPGPPRPPDSAKASVGTRGEDIGGEGIGGEGIGGEGIGGEGFSEFNSSHNAVRHPSRGCLVPFHAVSLTCGFPTDYRVAAVSFTNHLWRPPAVPMSPTGRRLYCGHLRRAIDHRSLSGTDSTVRWCGHPCSPSGVFGLLRGTGHVRMGFKDLGGAPTGNGQTGRQMGSSNQHPKNIWIPLFRELRILLFGDLRPSLRELIILGNVNGSNVAHQIHIMVVDRNVPSTGTYPRPERTLDQLPEFIGTLGAAPPGPPRPPGTAKASVGDEFLYA